MLVRRAVATGEGAHGLYPSRDGNDPYFGESACACGVWAASERYFGIPPRRLSPAQASLLAGLIQAPALYDRSMADASTGSCATVLSRSSAPSAGS
jgi:membrane peptidoglycan carboxypeptidase